MNVDNVDNVENPVDRCAPNGSNARIPHIKPRFLKSCDIFLCQSNNPHRIFT